jgi:putative transposase
MAHFEKPHPRFPNAKPVLSPRVHLVLLIPAARKSRKTPLRPRTYRETARAYQNGLAEHGIVYSMSRKGNCWGYAPTESFFRTSRTELVHHREYQTRDEARHDIFEYIEVIYNRQRRHSALGYLSPAQFEVTALAA